MLAQKLCDSSTEDVTLLLALVFNALCAITETSSQVNVNLMYAKLCLGKYEEIYNRDHRPTAYLATAYNGLGQACARNGLYLKASICFMQFKAFVNHFQDSQNSTLVSGLPFRRYRMGSRQSS